MQFTVRGLLLGSRGRRRGAIVMQKAVGRLQVLAISVWYESKSSNQVPLTL